MRRAYDSITAADIPLAVAIVCGYVDGIYRWSAQDWGRFPYAVKVGIAVSPYTDAGQVLDVETGDATPGQAPHWVLMRRAAGIDPTVYVNRANWDATRQAFQQQQVKEPHYWLAAYDGLAEVPAGTVAKQYADSAMVGAHYDLSAVADYWPGVDPFTQEEKMLKIITADGAKGNYMTDGMVKWWLAGAAVEGGPPAHLGGARDLFPEIPATIKVDRAYFDAIPEVASPTVVVTPPAVDLQPVLDAIRNLTLKANG